VTGRALGLLLCFLSVVSTASANPSAVNDLLQAAESRQLHRHAYWHKLLHYTGDRDSPQSEVLNPHFFLAPNGRFDARAELQATLRALFLTPDDKPDFHAQCRFVARFRWLQTKLNFPEESLPKVPCPQFERWANLQHLDGISVVFVSAYMDNPASFFGHILIKINLRGGIFGHSLLSPTLNFGANPNPDDNPLVYATKGIFGGYTGRFSDERFYNFQHVYGESELRDLWEFPLRLSRAQQERVLFHAWELLQNIQFRYYFFLENCAYRMAELLEMAWEDDRQVRPANPLWAIPIDVFDRLHKLRDAQGAPLLQEPTLVPSRQRRLRWKVQRLSLAQQNWVLGLEQSPSQLTELRRSPLSATEQAEALDAFIDLLQYQASRDDGLSEAQQAFRQRVLLQRSQLPILESVEPPATPSPIKGHPPLRTQLGLYTTEREQGAEFGVRAAYHDLLDPETGHQPYAELQALDLRLRVHEDGWRFHRATLFEIQNIALSPSKLTTVSGLSWRTSGAWEPESVAEPQHQVLRLTAGVGRAAFLAPKWAGFAFLDSHLQSRTGSMPESALALTPVVGALWRPSAVVGVLTSLEYDQTLLGERSQGLTFSANAAWQFHEQWGVRFHARQQGAAQAASLLFHRYW
jgi:hypothetical protein